MNKKEKQLSSLSSDHSSHPFNQELLDFFVAEAGAYSVVTEQEAEKGQITITGQETAIVEGHFGKADIHVGAKVLNPIKAVKPFYLYQDDATNRMAELTVNYPKPQKSELQVYTHTKEGFKPSAGDVWFIFRRKGAEHLFIGSMLPAEWIDICSDVETLIEDSLDIDDEKYQLAINMPSAPIAKKIIKSMQYGRDYAVARKRLEEAGYICEADKTHTTFKNRATETPYAEAHHLIPLSFQSQFEKSLDVQENIVVLCPNCHRKLHHAVNTESRVVLETLFKKHEKALLGRGLGVELKIFLSFYGA